jgi:hypothetical protein
MSTTVEKYIDVYVYKILVTALMNKIVKNKELKIRNQKNIKKYFLEGDIQLIVIVF